jgi:hypothetical protein
MELGVPVAYRGPDDPEDASGQHLLVGRSFKDCGNFVDLAAPAPSPPPASKEEEDWEFSDDDDDGGDGAESSDYNAFNRWSIFCIRRLCTNSLEIE